MTLSKLSGASALGLLLACIYVLCAPAFATCARSAPASVPAAIADDAHPWTAIDPTREHWNEHVRPAHREVVRLTSRLEPGESVTIVRGSLTLKLKSSTPEPEYLLPPPPPPGDFVASWMSHGVKIEVRLTQRDNEPDGAFATRCKNKVLVFEASFPRDPQPATQTPGPTWETGGTVTGTGDRDDVGGADGLGAHDWSAGWATAADWGNGLTGYADVVLSALQGTETDETYGDRCAAKLLAFVAEFPVAP